MNKHIFIWVLTILILSSFVYSTDFTEDNQFFVTLQNSTPSIALYDWSINGNNLTNYGATYDVIENAYEFDVSNTDNMKTSSDTPKNLDEWSVIIWVNPTVTTTQSFLTKNEAGANNDFIMATSTGNWFIGTDNGVSQYGVTVTDILPVINTWQQVVATYDGSTVKAYINGVKSTVETAQVGSSIISTGKEWEVGSDRDASYFDGHLSGISIYNKSLNSSEITELYEEDRTFNPYLESSPNNFTITSRDISNSQTISIFNATINEAFYDTTNGELVTPYLLNESDFLNITVEAESYFDYTNTSYNTSNGNLLVYLEPNELEDFILLTPNGSKANETSYNITYTEAVSPTNKTVTYNVTISYLNGTILNSTNTTNLYLNLNITDYEANIYNVSVKATEDSTNISYTHSSLLYIDKTNYIYFADIISDSPLINKNIDIIFPNNDTVEYTTDSEGKINFQSFDNITFLNGSYQITYLGDQGYISPTTFYYNTTQMPFNITYNISRANINIQVRDADSSNLITEYVLISINGLGVYNTSNGTLFLENQAISSQTYTIYVNSENYTTNQKTFTFTNQETISFTIYLIEKDNPNLGNIYVNVYDSYTYLLAGVDLRLQELDVSTSTFAEVGQKISSSGGSANFEVLLDERVYRVYARYEVDGLVYEGYSSDAGEVFFATEQIVPIYLTTVSGVDYIKYEGLNINVQNTTLINNVSFHQVDFNDINGIEHRVCLTYEYLSGFIWKNSLFLCSVGASGTINLGGGYLLDRDYSWRVEVNVIDSNGYATNFYSEEYKKTGSFEDTFRFIMSALIMLSFILGLAISLYLNRIDYFVPVTIFLSIFWLILAPSWVTASHLVFNIILGWFVYDLARKKTKQEGD